MIAAALPLGCMETLTQESPSSAEVGTDDALHELLKAIRKHFGMETAFISQFSDGQRVCRVVDSSEGRNSLKPSDSDKLEESYCQRIVDGRFPSFIPDAASLPEAARLPVTKKLSIGSYLGVPIIFSDGSLYGTLCCFSHEAQQNLNERDVEILQTFANIAAKSIEKYELVRRERVALKHQIGAVLSGPGLSMVYQPIYDLSWNRIKGFESLARFHVDPKQTPDVWFAQAAQVHLGTELEMKAIHQALLALPHLPQDMYVSVNASPETIVSEQFRSYFSAVPVERVVLEMTEHALVSGYDEVAKATCPFRDRGMKIAVDDAGAGYASFRHILKLSPDKIKLDRSLTSDIHADRSKQALTAALVAFGERTGSKIVAEGVEKNEELQMLRELGIFAAQGYLLGRPMPLEQARRLCNGD